jgi:hypothetical protein
VLVLCANKVVELVKPVAVNVPVDPAAVYVIVFVAPNDHRKPAKTWAFAKAVLSENVAPSPIQQLYTPFVPALKATLNFNTAAFAAV